MEGTFFLNDAMIETGLWRGPDYSTDSALGFPGPWLLVYPLCLACGCHRELQAPSGARAAGGCSAARHVAREEISGLNFTSHGRVWRPCMPVGAQCGDPCRVVPWQLGSLSGHCGDGTPACAGGV